MSSHSGCLGPIIDSIAAGLRVDNNPADIEQDQQQGLSSCKCGFGDLQFQSPPFISMSKSPYPARIQPLLQEKEKPLINLQDEDTAGYPSTLEDEIDRLSDDLREWSLKIFGYAEIAMKEFKTHDLIAQIFEQTPGWKVTRHAYGIQTAVEAIYTHGKGGRTVGFNSEMDALPGIGHACGHPLICISGIAAAMATAQTLKKTNTPGKVILLGTPAEETIGGKIQLLAQGAYRGMDACLMLHPGPFGGMLPMLAISQVKVEYFGRNAHAAGAPWDGINALDAAVSAYTNISLLRQQIRPDERVHGIIQGSETWVSNVIPDYAWLRYDIRAPTKDGMEKLKARVMKCFQAASDSSGCRIKVEEEMVYADLVNNLPLAQEYHKYMENVMGIAVPMDGPTLGSTDFGNVSYEVPSIHPIYAIPTLPGQGNHTRGFTKAAATEEAHDLTLKSAKGIAVTAWKVLADKSFAEEVHKAFKP
ncbi:hypothetical protein MJO29_002500 [Puccinia striiformis f. sp. tritici]|uniref:hypothetical protein n=1 Tax=Puccinia striiformis f. sp. tritici TaxID=168172 RepID=UPI002008C065|nr:hypothetical protein Pst134EA_005608 [Puccinia striiformis f. sp. tritici]KAH9471729.1 hypothetical protein Pst134EA_005608 [Puccinia striiformis f. sp. tritici]KAI7964402.1 hypothetical protein MJO29_002500 [Puccinia striiformis f. sp. tritici]KAI9618784.1 hypothetical protein H4Q26_012038 [Puccinia striiformis f. sp. tritici PST-130]